MRAIDEWRHRASGRCDALKALAWWLLAIIVSIALAAWTTLALAHPYGVHASAGKRPDGPGYAIDLGAKWVRVNTAMNGDDPNFKAYLDAGINLVITFTNGDPANIA